MNIKFLVVDRLESVVDRLELVVDRSESVDRGWSRLILVGNSGWTCQVGGPVGGESPVGGVGESTLTVRGEWVNRLLLFYLFWSCFFFEKKEKRFTNQVRAQFFFSFFFSSPSST